MNDLPKGGCETILVAEDDEALRRLASTVLSEFGYTVILAEDGADAIEKFRANNDAIRLVILDMLMPVKNGKEAYDDIKALNPDIRALFASGYTADIINKETLLDSHLDFIMKPLSPIDLLRKVREILDR
ncbi:MAG: response regulator [Nitrospirae bacterium]|nr:response regulator [Nitrospirota bacterium]